MVIRTWYPVPPRKNLCPQLRPSTSHLRALPRLQNCWPCWKVENSGVGLSKLLVASDVKVHWYLCFHLRHVSTYQIHSKTTRRRITSATGSGRPMGHHQCRFHS